ncbi:MAG: hypothetical protein JSW07_07300 [bacterium]|nr:MAG: hypothetical protein JSW07_07300 [bacterium]
MPLLFKVPIFIAFLIALIAWYLASVYLLKKCTTYMLHGKYFLANELILLLTIFGLFAFVWLLSGFLSIKLIIIFIICSHIGSIITGILWRLIGTTDIPWAASGAWTGAELTVKYSWVSLLLASFSLGLCISYPILCGIAYFSNPVPSPRVTILISLYTLIMIYGSGLGNTLPTMISTISSKNLDEDTRLRILLNHGGLLTSIALIIALIFWAFDIIGKSYIVIFVILGYFTFTILLPYFIGAQQAKKWRINLLEKKKGWLSNLLEVLEFPTPSQYRPKLEQLQNDLASEENKIIENDSMVKLGIEIDGIESTTFLPITLIEAYRDSRDLEPRFNYLDFVRHLKNKIGEILAELAKLKKGTDKVNRAREFTQHFNNQRDNLENIIEQERKTKPILSTALVGIVLAIIVPLLNEIGRWIWLTFRNTFN